MGIRGRKSEASLTVAANVVELKKLPEPPANLTPSQADIWRMVIASRAGDMIHPESYPVLVEYCRAIDAANVIATQVDEFDPEWAKDDDGLKRWDRLLSMQDRAAKAITAIATRMRITPQSRYQPNTAGRIANKGEKRKPWENEG